MAEDQHDDKSESLLWQLQQMFGHLIASEKQAYDTTPFACAYKDDQGKPVNVRIQQDVQEFCGVLADRLETR